ncbi:unnamed protein product [Cyclocybe aegerita]|uniref:Uncharacterized protein n=1 Tax=Cyclocybe aegerita TaxID=1973307 RepID=A0A8S0XSI8_CYCAE|nr:unnamed protein product [Cyclocybe aegerita]
MVEYCPGLPIIMDGRFAQYTLSSEPPSSTIMMPPPPPVNVNSPQVVQISSLTAVLARLGITIPIEDVIKAVHDENEANRAKLTAEATKRRAALRKLALEPIKASPGLKITTVSKFVPKPTPTEPTNVDPLAKERRRRLVELTKEAFPDGKVPDPFSLTWSV